MFNHAGFNAGSFNQTPSNTVSMSAQLLAESSMSAKTNARMTLKANLSAEASLSAKLYRLYTTGAELSATSGLSASCALIILMRSNLSATGMLRANASKYMQISLTFTGDFAPGDIIDIDVSAETIKCNGINVMRFTAGEFAALHPGQNILAYSDQEASRSVYIWMRHRDRFM